MPRLELPAILVIALAIHANGQTTTKRVSLTSLGLEADASCVDPQVSSDGRYVAFVSAATNLVPGDANGVTDIFLRDTLTGFLQRVSVATGGAEADGPSIAPAISGNGRYVSFQSAATNLVAGDTNGFPDVFLHDRVTGATTRESVSATGIQGNMISWDSSLSSDGRFLAFDSFATNIVPGDTNGTWDVFVRDRLLGTVERVSISTLGVPGLLPSVTPTISRDGRFVVFESSASTLVFGDTNLKPDIFLRDRTLATTERVSIAHGGFQANGSSLAPAAVSDDGLLVAFHSDATNLVAGDTNGLTDVFVRERFTGGTFLVSASLDGLPATGVSRQPAISANGRYVAFQSGADNLVNNDVNAVFDVFRRDLMQGVTTMLSQNDLWTLGNASSTEVALVASGKSATFSSSAMNLVASDLNGVRDVFVRAPLFDGNPGAENNLTLNELLTDTIVMSDPSVGMPLGGSPPDWLGGDYAWKIFPKETLRSCSGTLELSGIEIAHLDTDFTTLDAAGNNTVLPDLWISAGIPSLVVPGMIEPSPADPSGVLLSFGPEWLPDPGCVGVGFVTGWYLDIQLGEGSGTGLVVTADGATDLAVTTFLPPGMTVFAGPPGACGNGDAVVLPISTCAFGAIGETQFDWVGGGFNPYGGAHAGGGPMLGITTCTAQLLSVQFFEPMLSMRVDSGTGNGPQEGLAGLNFSTGLAPGANSIGVRVWSRHGVGNVATILASISPPLAPGGCLTLAGGAKLGLVPGDPLFGAFASIWTGPIVLGHHGEDLDDDPYDDGTFTSLQLGPVPVAAAGFTLYFQGIEALSGGKFRTTQVNQITLHP